MKVLYVYSFNKGRLSPFIQEQIDSLAVAGIEYNGFGIIGRGFVGYLKSLPRFWRLIRDQKYDLIHAHYGYCGVFACLQFRCPVVTTYHGTDIMGNFQFLISKVSIVLSRKNIYVSELLRKRAHDRLGVIVPCGVDTNIFFPYSKLLSRKRVGFSQNQYYILFSSAFDINIKNYPLAKKMVENIKSRGVVFNLIELKGYSRHEVATLLNAADIALMTSFSEGSPQFIKEALACNCPIVSTDVGDVKELISGIAGNIICNLDEKELENAVLQIINTNYHNLRTNGTTRIIESELDLDKISERIIKIYKEVLHFIEK